MEVVEVPRPLRCLQPSRMKKKTIFPVKIDCWGLPAQSLWTMEHWASKDSLESLQSKLLAKVPMEHPIVSYSDAMK